MPIGTSATATVAHAEPTNRQRPRPAKTTSAAANSGPRSRLPVYEYVMSPTRAPATTPCTTS